MSIIPILFSNEDGSTDIKFGRTNYGSGYQLPIPLPAEIVDEYDGVLNVRHFEFHQLEKFRIILYGGVELFRVENTGDAFIHRYLTVEGDQIKSSTTQTAIVLNGLDVEIQGNGRVADDLFVGGTATVSSTINGLSNLSVLGSGVFGGTLSAAGKFFDIPHPSRTGHRLRHACIEGPENTVFYRGKSNQQWLDYPSYWRNLVDWNSITVHVTSTTNQQLWCSPHKTGVSVRTTNNESIYDYSFLIIAERIDLPKLEVEYAV